MFESLALGLLVATLAAPPGSALPGSVLSRADAPRRAIDEGRMRVHVAVGRDGEPFVATDLDVYVRGSEEVLCVFRSGPQSGRKVLIAGERVWLLVPGTKNPIPVTPNQRLLGGASIADIARLELGRTFDGFARATTESIDGVACDVVDLKAKSRKAPYAAGVVWLARSDGFPRRLRLALPSGKEAKEIRFVAYGREAGRAVLRRMEIRHLLRSERGLRTTLDFVEYEPRTLADGFFEPARARELP